MYLPKVYRWWRWLSTVVEESREDLARLRCALLAIGLKYGRVPFCIGRLTPSSLRSLKEFVTNDLADGPTVSGGRMLITSTPDLHRALHGYGGWRP
jgi:hypothetical protein